MDRKPTNEELDQRVMVEEEAVKLREAEKRVKHLNLVLQAIRNVNQLIVKEKDRDRLLKSICENLTETRGYYNTWIALLDESRRLVTTAESGLGENFQPMIELMKRGELTDCSRKTLSLSDIVVVEDTFSTCTDCPLSDQYAGRGAITIRLEHGGKIYGLLSVSIPRDYITDEEEHLLFREVAGDIAFALYNIELEDERKQAEEALRDSEEELRLQAKNLKEMNTAMKILLDFREQEKAQKNKEMLNNLEKLVFPYINKLKACRSDKELNTYIDIIKSNLTEIASPLLDRTSLLSTKLTSTELEIVDLLKQGKSSKEIADFLKVSIPAVSFHRKNIRKKLDLTNKKVNLRAYLRSQP